MAQQSNAKDNAGIGIGVVQPQSGLDYPFVSPGLNADPTFLLDVRELFSDFYLSYDDPGYYWNEDVVVNPLRIYWLYGFGNGPAWSTGAQPSANIPTPTPAHAKDLVVVDSQGVVVFDSTKADEYTETVWGDHYKIFEWRQTFDGAAATTRVAVCRAIQFLNLHTNTTIPERPVEFCPRNAVLDERTIEKIPKRVLAMRVQNGDCITPWFHEKVTFVNGHNTEIELGEMAAILPGAPTLTTTLRRKNDIMFSAAPGSGFGQFGLCATGICEDDSPTNVCPPGEDVVIKICAEAEGEEIKSLNGVKPDDYGNINISAKDCIFVRKPADYTGDTPHNYATANNQQVYSIMHIGADCPPCCGCEDYLATADYLKNVADQYRVIGERAEAVQQLHAQNIARWNEQRICRTQRPLRLILVAQPCPCMDVVAMYCNQCESCDENVRLTVEFSSAPGGGTGVVDSRYTQIVGGDFSVPAVLNGGWPVFSADFPTVKAGSSVYVKFRLCFCPSFPYAIKGTLTGTKSTGPIRAGCEASAPAAVVEASQSLDCEI